MTRGVNGMNVKRVTVAIPMELYEAAERRAEVDNSNRSRLFTDAVRLYLEGASNTEYEKSMNELGKKITALEAKLKAEGEDRQRALAEQERRHQETLNEEERRNSDITKALRHEQELTESKLESAQRELQRERDLNRELRDDKEQLQKQLELVTLRLPAPREGFWARVFGRRKKGQEAGGDR